jgi:hypothetical protein
MRCRGLPSVANATYLSDFLCSGLPCVAPYCVPGGVRVVSGFPALPCSVHCRHCTASALALLLAWERGQYKLSLLRGQTRKSRDSCCEGRRFLIRFLTGP